MLNRRTFFGQSLGVLLLPMPTLLSDSEEIEKYIKEFTARFHINFNTIIAHKTFNICELIHKNSIDTNLNYAQSLTGKIIKRMRDIERKQSPWQIIKHVALFNNPIITVSDYISVVQPAIIYSNATIA